MSIIPEETFAAEVNGVVMQLEKLADGLANDGLLSASGTVLAARQTIRALWTRLTPVAEAAESPALALVDAAE